MTDITSEIVADHGLKPEEFDLIVERLGRQPNLVELGIFSVMWSEHCSYKSSRRHLAKLPTDGPQVIQGPGENAGVVDIGDGQAVVFKMESHNHPSFIEPYQGAATGVGGIMRDVFTMGARPIANMNALRFGALDHPKTKHLLGGVVAGIGGYGNCMGVPTVGGETNFDAAYNNNILVNAMCVGLADTDKVFYSAAKGVGNPVVYVGAKTGRDGIHGATMASAEFDDASEEKRPTVQVGDPFTEKLLLEACLELMAKDAIIAIQDMGAAGLTSSSVEMADKGGVGIALNLDAVPQREEAMTAYEMMLSESQERMLMVLRPGEEAMAKAIFDKWEIDFAVIGETTDTGRLVISHHGAVVADMPIAPLSDDAPNYDRPYTPIAPLVADGPDTALKARAATVDMQAALLTLMASPNLCARRWIWEQYDHTVMGDTLQIPGGDAGVVRVHGTNKAVAVTTDVTPRYCAAHPFEGGKQAVAEAWRNLIAVGAEPLAVTNCLNFGNPERPEVMSEFVGCIEGMAEACRALAFPVVSGNVSLYNETNGVGIPPTPAIGGVGLISDIGDMTRLSTARDGDVLLLLGETSGHLSRSLFAETLLSASDGPPPATDLELERRHGQFVVEARTGGDIHAVHDVSDGGALIAIAEMCLAAGRGADLYTPRDEDAPAAFWFGEDQGRYLLAVPQSSADRLHELAAEKRLPLITLGAFGGESLILDGRATPLDELRAAHENTLPDFMS